MLTSERPNRLEGLGPDIFYKISSFAGRIAPVSKKLEDLQNFLVLTTIQNMELFSRYLNINPNTSSLRGVNECLKRLLPENKYNKASNFGINDINRYCKLREEMTAYEDFTVIQLAKILERQIPNIPLNNAEKIRDFLKNPANSEMLNTITELDLSTSNSTFNTKPNFQIIPEEIRCFPNLTKLNLIGNKISDLSPIAELRKLRTLHLSSTNVSDLTALGGLENLTYLNLSENKVSDLTALAVLENLTYLDLSRTSVSDLTALGRLENLTDLNLSQNEISDLSALAGLVKVKTLNLSFNQISDLSALAGLVELKTLSLTENQIFDLAPLAGLVELKTLSLTENQIFDLAPLAGLVGLKTLSLTENQIFDLTPLAGLVSLQALSLAKNQIHDLTPLTNLKKLSYLYLKRNKISDLTPILDLELHTLKIARNYLDPVSDELRKRLYEIFNFNSECLACQY
jgi:Leucine-rich repeat (LRR) protein